MGTSSSYEAPTGGKWTTAKTTATNFATQFGTDDRRTSPHDLTAAYVAAIGGAAGAASRALGARRTAGALGSLFGRAADVGLSDALRERGLEHLVGRPPLEVLSALVDGLAGSADTPEGAADRDALLALFGQELMQAATYEDLELLLVESLDAAGLMRLLQLFVLEYVYRRLRQELGNQLEKGARSPADLPAIEADLRAYLAAAVTIEFEQVDVVHFNWEGAEGASLLEKIFQSAYSQIQ